MEQSLLMSWSLTLSKNIVCAGYRQRAKTTSNKMGNSLDPKCKLKENFLTHHITPGFRVLHYS